MSFGICRVQNFKRQAIRGQQIHDRRERPSRSNPDIDQAKAGENYSLLSPESTYSEAIKARINELPPRDRAIRSDAVLMSQILVTSDKPFFDSLAPERQREFFQQSLSFIQERYGRENVIAATVHMDEKTPHMHVSLVPVVTTEKGPELNRKALWTKTELITLQDQFHAKLGASWGLKRGQSREGKTRHLSVAEFKLKTQAEAQEAERQDLLRQKEKLERESAELQAQAERLSALGALKIREDDFTQKVVGEKKTFLTTTKLHETPKQVRERIENDYLKPIAHAKVTAEKEAAALKVENQELQKRLEPYRKIEEDLKPEQVKEVQAKASVEAQKYRHTNAAEAKLAEERQKFRYELLNTKRLGGLSIVGEQMRLAERILEQWDKAPDKRVFENDVRERFCKGRSQGMGR